MFRSIKVSVTLGAAVLIASPGCCLPNLLCSHSSPSEETVVSGYSNEYVGDYSVVSSDCGCGCGVAAGETVSTGEFQVPTEAVDNDAYLVNMPASETGAAGGSATKTDSVEGTLSTVDSIAGSATKAATGDSAFSANQVNKVLDVVKPPAGLKKPLENALPGNLLP